MKILWNTCLILFVILSVITFTPLIIAQGTTSPWLFGMPRTLWAGIFISIALFIITLVAAYAAKDLE